jgi:hypothetical protein
MRKLIRLAWAALFLNEGPYAEMRDSPDVVLRGLGLVLVVAVAVALVGLVGTTLEWATTPGMRDVQQVVWEGLQQMPWYRQLQRNPEFREQFPQQFEMGWRILPHLLGAPDIARAALRIVLLPLGLALAWFLYGVVAHLFARLLGGQGSVGQTLGCTALAVAPQLLNLVTFFPYLVVGGVVGTWTILCRYVALKTSHRLTWSRALAATLLPYAVLAVVVSFFACLAGVAAALIFGGGTSQ